MNAVVGTAALASGEIDYYTVLAPGSRQRSGNCRLRLWPATCLARPTALIARPEFKSVQEVRGKTIGLNILGGALEVTAKLIFTHFGLDKAASGYRKLVT
jgi:hypothetical protein